MFRFASPWMLLLLLLAPAAWYLYRRGKSRGSVRFSTTASVKQLGHSARRTFLGLPFVLRAAVLVLIAIALARPQMGTERVLDISQGIAIEMVVDRSSSMQAELTHRGRRMNRLDVALDLFREFVAGRPADLIGVVTFARYADTICPLTLDHDTLTGFLPTVRLVERESEDGTAIGDAVALAAARLEKAEEALARQLGTEREYDIQSKVIILLTDGENNAGDRTPAEAADLAAAWGVKIYAIGIGGASEGVIRTPFGTMRVPGRSQVDEEALRTLAETTGGVYRVAEDADSLEAIYHEIDQLETSEIESTRYTDYRELFPPFALAALALLGAEVLLGATLLRRIP